jgi:hypothetical protein
MRKRLRRIKRYTILGLVVGGVVALRRASAGRQGRVRVGAPPTWPPLQPGEQPVAAVGDLVAAADRARAGAAHPTDAAPAAPVPSDEPVAAVGDLASADPAAGECDGYGAAT